MAYITLTRNEYSKVSVRTLDPIPDKFKHNTSVLFKYLLIRKIIIILYFVLYYYKQIQDENPNCYGCRNNFDLSNTIIVVEAPYGTYHEYHLKCYIKHASKYGNLVENKLLYPDNTSRLTGYSLLNSSQQECINKMMFPNLQKEHIRCQLSLGNNYNLKYISDDDLIIALQQRNIATLDENLCNNNNNYVLLKNMKETMIYKLEEFLGDNKCKMKNINLTYGFCRFQDNNQNLILPECLIRLILLFGPTFVSQKIIMCLKTTTTKKL